MRGPRGSGGIAYGPPRGRSLEEGASAVVRVFLQKEGGGLREGGGGTVGGGTPPPASGNPELLEAPKAPRKFFGLK